MAELLGESGFSYFPISDSFRQLLDRGLVNLDGARGEDLLGVSALGLEGVALEVLLRAPVDAGGTLGFGVVGQMLDAQLHLPQRLVDGRLRRLRLPADSAAVRRRLRRGRGGAGPTHSRPSTAPRAWHLGRPRYRRRRPNRCRSPRGQSSARSCSQV